MPDWTEHQRRQQLGLPLDDEPYDNRKDGLKPCCTCNPDGDSKHAGRLVNLFTGVVGPVCQDCDGAGWV
jgi:hypothetical protein